MDTLKYRALTNFTLTVKSDVIVTDEGVRVHIDDGAMTPQTDTFISGATDKPMPNDVLAKLIHSMLTHLITKKLSEQHPAPEGSKEEHLTDTGKEAAQA